MRKLIVNADDFGLSPGTNRAIMQLLELGAISSTTIMANGPANGEALQQVMRTSHKNVVGLHVNLTQFSPLNGGEGLDGVINEKGVFKGRRSLFSSWISGRLDYSGVKQEIEAQLRYLTDSGLVPSHLDTHQHAQAVPVVCRALHEVARENGLLVRSLHSEAKAKGFERLVRKALLNWLEKKGSRKYGSTTASGTHLVSIFSTGGLPSVEAYAGVLQACEADVVELMVHPSYVDEQHENTTGISEISQMDWEVLSSDAWLDFLRKSELELVSFADLNSQF